MNDGGVQTLSAQLGYSTRHLHRTLSAELGAGPLALARAHRMHLARSLLVGTQMSITDIAFASGFSSVRQFNETASKLFGAAPREIRQRAHQRRSTDPRFPTDAESSDHQQGDAGSSPQLSLRLALPVREPFNAVEAFTFLAQRAIPGVETTQLDGEALVYARTLRLPHGPAAIEVTATQLDAEQAGSWQLEVECELSAWADIPAAVAGARRIFDLDADPLAVADALSTDPALAPLVAQSPGLRLPGTADGPEYLIRAIVGQQISVVAARTHLTRLVDALGTGYVSSFAGLSLLFPIPEQIIAGVPDPLRTQSASSTHLDPDRPLRLPARSIATVRSVSKALASGEILLHQGADSKELHDQLIALPGIGPWTASYLMLRVLGDPDVWMTGDVVLLNAAKKLGLLDPELKKSTAHRTLQAHAQRWSPWRSYAAMYLWKAASQDASEQQRKDTTP